ncbi:hypothetical protein ACFPRL_18780 [Pseudoclavibacter helvolus]
MHPPCCAARWCAAAPPRSRGTPNRGPERQAPAPGAGRRALAATWASACLRRARTPLPLPRAGAPGPARRRSPRPSADAWRPPRPAPSARSIRRSAAPRATCGAPQRSPRRACRRRRRSRRPSRPRAGPHATHPRHPAGTPERTRSCRMLGRLVPAGPASTPRGGRWLAARARSRQRRAPTAA